MVFLGAYLYFTFIHTVASLLLLLWTWCFAFKGFPTRDDNSKHVLHTNQGTICQQNTVIGGK